MSLHLWATSWYHCASGPLCVTHDPLDRLSTRICPCGNQDRHAAPQGDLQRVSEPLLKGEECRYIQQHTVTVAARWNCQHALVDECGNGHNVGKHGSWVGGFQSWNTLSVIVTVHAALRRTAQTKTTDQATSSKPAAGFLTRPHMKPPFSNHSPPLHRQTTNNTHVKACQSCFPHCQTAVCAAPTTGVGCAHAPATRL